MNEHQSIDYRRALPSDAEVRVSPDQIRARFRVPEDHPAFGGHFPGSPILPGVVLLAWMQSLVRSMIGAPQPKLTCRNLKFLRPVLPGEELTLHASIDAAYTHVHVQAEGEPAAVAVFIPPSSHHP